jgi:DNA replication protein DnaC
MTAPGSIIITSNLPFDEWTEVFGSERLTGAILDRLIHGTFADNPPCGI